MIISHPCTFADLASASIVQSQCTLSLANGPYLNQLLYFK
jgi:hypothetical protein